MLWTVGLEKTHESPLDSKEIKPVNPKGNQHRIIVRRTVAEIEAPILWLPDVKSWHIGKDPDAGKDWGQMKGMTEDEMIGWHHRPSGHEFEQTLGDTDGRGSLACCTLWTCKDGTWLSDWTATATTLGCLTTGGPHKELGTSTENPTGRIRQGQEEMPAHNTIQWCPRLLQDRVRFGWEMHVTPGRTLSQTKHGQTRWLARDNLETNPIYHKSWGCKTCGRTSLLHSLTLLPQPGSPCPIKFFVFPAHVFPQTIHFQVSDKSPLSGLGRGPPFCNSTTFLVWCLTTVRKQHVHVGLPDGSTGKESTCDAGDTGSIPRSGTSPGEVNGNPLQHFWLGSSMDSGA